MEEVARDFCAQANRASAGTVFLELAGDVLPQRHYGIFFRTWDLGTGTSCED